MENIAGGSPVVSVACGRRQAQSRPRTCSGFALQDDHSSYPPADRNRAEMWNLVSPGKEVDMNITGVGAARWIELCIQFQQVEERGRCLGPSTTWRPAGLDPVVLHLGAKRETKPNLKGDEQKEFQTGESLAGYLGHEYSCIEDSNNRQANSVIGQSDSPTR